MAFQDAAAQASGASGIVTVGSAIVAGIGKCGGIATIVGSEAVDAIARLGGLAAVSVAATVLADAVAASLGAMAAYAIGDIALLEGGGGGGPGAGAYVDPALLRKKVKIRKTHVMKVGQWPVDPEEAEDDLHTLVEYHRIRGDPERYNKALSLKKEKKDAHRARLKRSIKDHFWD